METQSESELREHAAEEKTAMTSTDYYVVTTKSFRKRLDELLQELKFFQNSWVSNESYRNARLAAEHIEDSIMRLGMVLKALGESNPYPNSYDPSNTVVDPTADGLKL